MIFNPGDTITVLRVQGLNYAFPLLSKSQIDQVIVTGKEKGLELKIHKESVDIYSDLTEQMPQSLQAVDGYPHQAVLACKDSFAARECPKLLNDLGILCPITFSPLMLIELSLVIDEQNARVVATKEPGECEVIETAHGNVDKEKQVFTCDLGEYPYVESMASSPLQQVKAKSKKKKEVVKS